MRWIPASVAALALILGYVSLTIAQKKKVPGVCITNGVRELALKDRDGNKIAIEGAKFVRIKVGDRIVLKPETTSAGEKSAGK